MACCFKSRALILLWTLLPALSLAGQDQVPWALLTAPQAGPVTEVRLGIDAVPSGPELRAGDFGSLLDGRRPVGVEIDADTAYLLCEPAGPESSAPSAPSTTDWVIRTHSDWNTLHTEIADRIRAGETPLDFARTESSVVILWAPSARRVTEWRLTSCAESVPELTRNLQLYGEHGFQLAGVSGMDGRFWLLFVKAHDGQRSSAVVSVRTSNPMTPGDLDHLTRAVSSARRSGWDLSGLATGAHGHHLAVKPRAPESD